jgi:uncharacterized membrane protein
MKTKVLVGALLFLIVLNLATLGTWLYVRFVAPPAEPVLPMGGPPELMRELNDSTRQQLRAVMMEFRRDVMPLQRQVRAAEDSIALWLQQDPVPVSEVQDVLRRAADLRASISIRAVERLVATKQFLTPEQQRMFFRAIIEAQPRGPRSDGFGARPGAGRRPGFGQGPRPERMGPMEEAPPR